MFMQTNVSSYYLPLYGTQVKAVGTEIGADCRSVLVRPIAATGETALPPTASITEVTAATGNFRRFNTWLAGYSAYRRAAVVSEPATTLLDRKADMKSAENSPESAQEIRPGQPESAKDEAPKGGLQAFQPGLNRS